MQKSLIGIMAMAAAFSATANQDPASGLNQKLFEPTYRAAKAIQGAASTGVTYAKYSELLQALTTEFNILKDQRPTGEQNARLLELFQETLAHYEAAGIFWKAKIDGPTRGPSRAIKGIPIFFENQKADDAKLKLAQHYGLPIEKANAGGALARKLEYRWIPDDSPQRIWVEAEKALTKATDLYYGR